MWARGIGTSIALEIWNKSDTSRQLTSLAFQPHRPLFYILDVEGKNINRNLPIRPSIINMSDGIHPTGPSQPGIDRAYEVNGNPTQKTPIEARRADRNAQATEEDAM
jgi:hypothetical protein